MSDFAHPGRLWLLVGVVALAALPGLVERQRARSRAAYADAQLLDSVAPRRAPLRRVAPVAVSLAALAVLVVATAQPTRDEVVPRRQGVVVLAVDVSASMAATDVAPDRLAAASAGGVDFVADVPEGIHVGLVAFDGEARLITPPTTDHEEVARAIRALRTGPGTAAGDGIAASLSAIEASLSPDLLGSGEDLPAAVVLLSDGVTTVGRPVDVAAAAAADLGVPITTIAFGTPEGTVRVQGEVVPVPADTATMRMVAQRTGGSYHEATTAGELVDVYADIRSAVGTTTEQREITVWLLGGGLVLAALAAALTIGWSR